MSFRDDEAWRLVELERAQIGHDLHDDLIPLLFAARAGAESVLALLVDDGCKESQTQAKVVNWLEAALIASRNVITHLQPLELECRDWSNAAKHRLESLFSHVAEFQDAEIAWSIDSATRQVDEPFATTLFRLTVESVRNALTHGRAKKISVISAIDGEVLRLTISDNGCGFDPSAVGGDHFGIEIMRRRAALVGGAVEIVSQPGHPTTVIGTLPLTVAL